MSAWHGRGRGRACVYLWMSMLCTRTVQIFKRKPWGRALQQSHLVEIEWESNKERFFFSFLFFILREKWWERQTYGNNELAFLMGEQTTFQLEAAAAFHFNYTSSQDPSHSKASIVVVKLFGRLLFTSHIIWSNWM